MGASGRSSKRGRPRWGEVARVRAGSRHPSFVLTNRSGYDTRDLAVWFARAFAACHVRTSKRVLVTASPIRTRGCATVSRDTAGAVINVAIAPPSQFTKHKFARILMHECAHLHGTNHEDMQNERLLYSEGGLPAWAKGLRMRYIGRAPEQLQFLRRLQSRKTRSR